MPETESDSRRSNEESNVAIKVSYSVKYSDQARIAWAAQTEQKDVRATWTEQNSDRAEDC